MLYTLNEFMRIRLEDPMVCDLLLDGRSYRFPDVRCLPVLASIDAPLDREAIAKRLSAALGVDVTAADRLTGRFIATRILRPADHEHELMPQVRMWEKYGWTDALVFHCLTEGHSYVDVAEAEAPGDPDAILTARLAARPVPSFWKRLPVPYQQLPEPIEPPARDLGDVLLSRRTHVPWSGQRLTASQLSRVLWDANVPLVEQRHLAERTYSRQPSALLKNAYGDLETYLFVYDVADVEPGLYHYAPDTHALGLISAGDYRDRVRKAFVGQWRAGSGACSLLISVVWDRQMFRYVHSSHAYRALMMVMGQFAQRYLVAWTSLGYTTFPTPAHRPELTDELLGTDRFEEAGIYLITAG
jgi:SagB-type dehydrogenase family enzyme